MITKMTLNEFYAYMRHFSEGDYIVHLAYDPGGGLEEVHMNDIVTACDDGDYVWHNDYLIGENPDNYYVLGFKSIDDLDITGFPEAGEKLKTTREIRSFMKDNLEIRCKNCVYCQKASNLSKNHGFAHIGKTTCHLMDFVAIFKRNCK